MATEIQSIKTNSKGNFIGGIYPTLIRDRHRINQQPMLQKGLELAVSPTTTTNSMTDVEAGKQLARVAKGQPLTGAAATMASNVDAVIESAKKDGNFDGSREWYFKANNFAKHLSQKHNVSEHQAAGVLASLSGGGGEWETNKRNADRFLNFHINGQQQLIHPKNFHGVEASRLANAASIMLGDHPNKVLGNLKENTFFENIHNPEGSGSQSTQDTHMSTVMRGWKRPWRGRGGGAPELQKPNVYKLYQGITEQVGKSHGLTPIETQPVVWDEIKRIGPKKGTPMPTHPEFANYYNTKQLPAKFSRRMEGFAQGGGEGR